MQEQDTINILVSQLLSKDDELLRLRTDNERLLSEQREGNRQILEKLDRTFDELKSMRIDNKYLSDQLSKALEAKAQVEKQSELLSSALEELKNLCAAELFEIEKQKRHLYGCKSEKSSSLFKDTDKDLKNDKDDFDGSTPAADTCSESSASATPVMDFASTLFIKAVRYAVNEWEAVCRYVNNGRAEIDNNTAKRLMKPVCLGRKNYLFCGSEQAAKNTSLIYSIIKSCKMHRLRPVKYKDNKIC